LLEKARELKLLNAYSHLARSGHLPDSVHGAILHWLSQKFLQSDASSNGNPIRLEGAVLIHALNTALADSTGASLVDAWQQLQSPRLRVNGGEIARPTPEAIIDLEHDAFSQTLLAGKAGLQQWGLDAGHHQDLWNPYNCDENKWTD